VNVDFKESFMKIGKIFTMVPGLLMFLSVPVFAQNGVIVTEVVKYTAGEVELQGYLAYDSSISGSRPGVIVVHEWTGLNDYAKYRARELAKQGYVAFAADMYGGGKEVPTSEARSLSGQVGSDFPLIIERFTAAIYPGVNAHNFTNPEGSSYYPKEADDAWGKMLDFFQEVF
jgi:dienelactone hydrolase